MKCSIMKGGVTWCNRYMCICVWCFHGGEVD